MQYDKKEKNLGLYSRIRKEGNITEDEKFRAKEDLQKIIDEVNNNLEAIFEKKEKEVLN